MTLPTQHRPSATDVERMQRRSRNILAICETINDALPLIQDPDLRERCLDFLEQTEQMGTVSLLDQIEGELTRLNTEYDMRRVDRGDDGEFPEKCSGCEHHPHACPIFYRSVYRDTRERLSSELIGRPEPEVKRKYRQFASDVGCEVIPEEIEDWEGEHAGDLEEGQALRREVFSTVYAADPSQAGTDQVQEAVSEAAGQGRSGPDERGAASGGDD